MAQADPGELAELRGAVEAAARRCDLSIDDETVGWINATPARVRVVLQAVAIVLCGEPSYEDGMSAFSTGVTLGKLPAKLLGAPEPTRRVAERLSEFVSRDELLSREVDGQVRLDALIGWLYASHALARALHPPVVVPDVSRRASLTALPGVDPADALLDALHAAARRVTDAHVIAWLTDEPAALRAFAPVLCASAGAEGRDWEGTCRGILRGGGPRVRAALLAAPGMLSLELLGVVAELADTRTARGAAFERECAAGAPSGQDALLKYVRVLRKLSLHALPGAAERDAQGVPLAAAAPPAAPLAG